jgi:molybdopterin-guanine dinucleotide biosynthesis protein A
MNNTGNPYFSVAILAGGRSRRMGENKALLKVGGVAVLQRVINAVKNLTDDLFLVTNTPQVYQNFSLPMALDVIPDKAALGGVYTAILQSRHEWTLVLACDMPLLKTQVIIFLADYLNTADVVCPLIKSYPETLHTFYRKTCLPIIKRQIAADILKINDFFDQVNVRYINEAMLSSVTPNYNFLLNVNTPADLAMARSVIETDG